MSDTSISTVSSIKAHRNSSLELLRVLSMFLVLLLHANFTTFGFPSVAEARANPLPSFLQLSAEALCIVAVNTYILISGYFGIRMQGKGLANLLFQSSFYSASAYLLFLVISGYFTAFKLSTLLTQCMPLLKAGGWFLPSYVGLMLLSPLLERALAQMKTRELGRYLLLYYILHTIWVFFFKTMDGNDGYSIFSFIGIYLLGSYLKRTKVHWSKILRWKFLAGYISISLFSALLFLGISIITGITLEQAALPYWFMSYASPLVIASAVCLFLFFASRDFHSKWINAIAGSTLAVYLLHCHDGLFSLYREYIWQLHFDKPIWLFLLELLAFIVAVFGVSILIDQLRLVLWKYQVLPLYLRIETAVKRRFS